MKPNSQKGSTLLEALLYIALFGFIFSSTLLAVYQILSSSDTQAVNNENEQEANFVIAKINWALTDVQSINNPPPNTTSINNLSVSKNGGYAGNPIVFSYNNISKKININDGGTTLPLNSDYISIASVSFQHIQQTGLSTVDSVKVSFYIDGKRFETYRSIR